MHVEAKQVAVSGLIVAISVLCMILGSVFEMNTLFLLAFASYLLGILIREFGLRTALAGYIGAVLLGFLLAPNKFYVITYAGMGSYIVLSEYAFRRLSLTEKLPSVKWKKGVLMGIKLTLFNLMLITCLLIFPEMILGTDMSILVILGIIIVAQLGLFIYDKAYIQFMKQIKFRI